MPLEAYLIKLLDLLVAPFLHFGKVWLGILPVYVSLLLGELSKGRVTFSETIGNGFVMVWAGLNWAMHLADLGMFSYFGSAKDRTSLAWIVTVCAIAVGVFTIVLGVRKKDRTFCGILGHPRFSSYFLILLYPMQIGIIHWNSTSLAAILIFALPVWLLLYLCGRLATSLLK